MSKYLEFKEIPFKGKTKRFEIISKTSFEKCPECMDQKYWSYHHYSVEPKCHICNNKRKIPIVLGKISWYPQWRQYIFSSSSDTVWNRDCLNSIIVFIDNLMRDRKIVLMENNK